MTLPDIGHAIANEYNVILVCMSSSQNYTIFPLLSTPPSNITQHHIICIGHVHGCHFVQVILLICVFIWKLLMTPLTIVICIM